MALTTPPDDLPMPDPTSYDCDKCGSGRVVPLYHERMMGAANGGNPYRLYCLDCEKFGHAVSKQFFKTHLRPYVLPKDQPLEDSEAVIPIHEWEGSEFAALQERSQSLAECDPDDRRPYRATSENTFYCPDCGAFRTGYPESCSCGSNYRWQHSAMTDTGNSIQAAAESSSDTPAIADGTISDRIPRPTRRQAILLAALAAVVVVALALRARQQQSAAAEKLQEAAGEAAEAVENSDESLDIQGDPTDPLAADEEITEALRNNGRLSEPEDDAERTETEVP